MKKSYVLGFMSILVLGFLFVGIGVNASSDEVATVDDTLLEVDEATGEYTLESMLTFAIMDEYLAKATYLEIIEVFGDIKPFSKIVLAEQTHINLLITLFETYGVEIPSEDLIGEIVVPESISNSLATGVEAEKLNIAIYESFLSQTNLPDDVREVFELLKAASEKHLSAFSKDRLVGAGYDMANQWRKMFGQGGAFGRGHTNSRGNQRTNA